MANITVTEAANFIPEIWAAEALGYFRANTVLAGLVNRNYEDEVANAGDMVHVPKRGTLSTNAKAANTGVTLQTPSSDVVTVTLNNHREVSFLVEDVAKAQSRPDVIGGYIQDGMAAISEYVDATLAALYTGFTATAIDATGAAIDADTVVEARRLLNSYKAPLANRYCIWHEDAEAEILKIEKFTNSQWINDAGAAMREAYIGRRYGFDHLMDQKITVAAGECKNLAMHRDALTLVTRPLPPVPPDMGAQSSVMVEDGIAIRVIWSYNPTYLGVQVTLDILFGCGVLNPNFGVAIRSTEV